MSIVGGMRSDALIKENEFLIHIMSFDNCDAVVTFLLHMLVMLIVSIVQSRVVLILMLPHAS